MIRLIIDSLILAVFSIAVYSLFQGAMGAGTGTGQRLTEGAAGQLVLARAAEPTPTPTAKPTPKPTATPIPGVPTATPIPVTPVFLQAEYRGGNIKAGEKFSRDDLKVFVYYNNGADEELPKDEYVLSDEVVRNAGENKYTVLYKGLTASFSVTGKVIQSLFAANNRQLIYLGNMIDERDVIVSASYTDGSSELITEGFTFIPETLTQIGTHDVTVQYGAVSSRVQVTVQPAPELSTLTVAYEGKAVKADSPIKRSEIAVYGIYANGTAERLTTYNLDTPSIHDIGKGFIRVSYQGKSASAEVRVEEKSVASIRAEYKGDVVEVNREFDYNDLYVYLVYDDDTVARTEDYVVYQRFVKYVGENTIKVYAKSLTATFVVKGVEAQEPTFDYVSLFTIESGDLALDVTTAIPAFLPESSCTGKAVKKSKLNKIISRLNIHETAQYIGFSYAFENEDNEDELPLDVRITLPDGFESTYTELYYTPNLKSIVARMNKTDLDETTIESTLFRAGTYILVYDPEAYIEEEYDEDAEDEED